MATSLPAWACFLSLSSCTSPEGAYIAIPDRGSFPPVRCKGDGPNAGRAAHPLQPVVVFPGCSKVTGLNVRQPENRKHQVPSHMAESCPLHGEFSIPPWTPYCTCSCRAAPREGKNRRRGPVEHSTRVHWLAPYVMVFALWRSVSRAPSQGRAGGNNSGVRTRLLAHIRNQPPTRAFAGKLG